MRLPKDPVRKLEWLHPYVIDWGTCGDGFGRFRVLTTLCRWFDAPADRAFLYARAVELYGAEFVAWTPEHEANCLDLMGAEVRMHPTLSAARFGRFLMALRHGNLVTGFLTGVPTPLVHLRSRPGYAFVWAHWFSYFPLEPCPWPPWLFAVQAFR